MSSYAALFPICIFVEGSKTRDLFGKRAMCFIFYGEPVQLVNYFLFNLGLVIITKQESHPAFRKFNSFSTK